MTESLLQFGGRLHPMLLHLPIGLLVGLGLLEGWTRVRGRSLDRGVRLSLVWIAALSAVVTAVSGLLLARESAYVGDIVDLHRWLGISVAAASLLAALLLTGKKNRGYGVTLVLGLAVLLPAGHFGASMTHGEGFLFAPFRQDAPAERRAHTGSSVYASEIEPILTTYCTACHGAARRKGRLALHTPADVLTGGQGGAVIVPGSADGSEIIRRLRLPPEDDEHMPPATKPQPTPAEIAAIARWIAAGAVADTARPLLTADAEADEPSDAAAPASTVVAPPASALAALLAANVHAEVIDPATGALWVDFSAAPRLDGDTAVALLAPIAPFVSDLGLSGAVDIDAILAACASMPRLRRLDLSRSDVTAQGVASIATHAQLEEINLVHTTVGDDVVAHLGAMPALRHLHTWNSGISATAIERLQRLHPSLTVNAGDDLASAALETEPPFTVGASGSLAPINTSCPVSGAPIDPAFAIVHEGRVVAFCCATCAGKFWADPAAFPLDEG